MRKRRITITAQVASLFKQFDQDSDGVINRSEVSLSIAPTAPHLLNHWRTVNCCRPLCHTHERMFRNLTQTNHTLDVSLNGCQWQEGFKRLGSTIHNSYDGPSSPLSRPHAPYQHTAHLIISHAHTAYPHAHEHQITLRSVQRSLQQDRWELCRHDPSTVLAGTMATP